MPELRNISTLVSGIDVRAIPLPLLDSGLCEVVDQLIGESNREYSTTGGLAVAVVDEDHCRTPDRPSHDLAGYTGYFSNRIQLYAIGYAGARLDE